jgi:hypothetical protein
MLITGWIRLQRSTIYIDRTFHLEYFPVTTPDPGNPEHPGIGNPIVHTFAEASVGNRRENSITNAISVDRFFKIAIFTLCNLLFSFIMFFRN